MRPLTADERALAQSTWALGVGDDVWWSRLAPPDHHGGTATAVTHHLPAVPAPTDDPEPTALAGDGRLVRPGPPQADQRWRRCGAGCPVRAGTSAVWAWCSAHLAAQGCTALLLIWDHASWPRSQAVRRGSRRHHQQGKRGAIGVRRVISHVPSRRPWLPPSAPTWVPGQRAVSEADRRRRADALEARVDAYDSGQGEAHLVMPKKVA